jgi:hypothetical protein
MGDFNCNIGKRQSQKTHILDFLKYWKSGNCNSEENRLSKVNRCKEEEKNVLTFMEPKIWKPKCEI